MIRRCDTNMRNSREIVEKLEKFLHPEFSQQSPVSPLIYYILKPWISPYIVLISLTSLSMSSPINTPPPVVSLKAIVLDIEGTCCPVSHNIKHWENPTPDNVLSFISLSSINTKHVRVISFQSLSYRLYTMFSSLTLLITQYLSFLNVYLIGRRHRYYSKKVRSAKTFIATFIVKTTQ